jgi:tyrosine-protein kinase Etk/Wzc
MKNKEEINLYDYWLVIKKNLWFIIILFTVAVLITMLVSFSMPKIYRATASVFSPLETGRISGLETLISATGIKGIPSQASASDVFLSILKSRSMADKVIDGFNLQEIYQRKTREDTRKILAAMTEINISREKLITVSVMDNNPQRAAEIANFYVSALDKLNRNLNITAAGQTRKFIEERLQETTAALRETEERVENYQIQHRVSLGREMQESARVAGDLQGKFVAAKIQLEAKKNYTTSRNPEIIKLENEVRELEQALLKLPPMETEMGRLIRELKTQETLYNLLIRQYEQAKIEEARDTPTVQVLDWAVVPEKKYKPIIRNNMMVAGIMAMFLGVLVSFFKEYYRREITNGK